MLLSSLLLVLLFTLMLLCLFLTQSCRQQYLRSMCYFYLMGDCIKHIHMLMYPTLMLLTTKNTCTVHDIAWESTRDRALNHFFTWDWVFRPAGSTIISVLFRSKCRINRVPVRRSTSAISRPRRLAAAPAPFSVPHSPAGR